MSHNGQDNDDRRSLDLSEDEQLAQMERDAKATRQRLVHQERAIELMRKQRTLKCARTREGERREREKADQKATGRDAYYGNSDGEAELKDEEWSDNEQAAKRMAKEEERDYQEKAILKQQQHGKSRRTRMSAEAQLQANYDEDEFEEVDDEAEEADEIDEENKRGESKIESTAKRRQKVLAVKSKGQLVSNREACERCRDRHQPCHKQEGRLKIVCYECAEKKSWCSWRSGPLRKAPSMCTAKEVDNLKHALRSREAQRQPNVDEDGDDGEGDEISEENTREINETGQASFAERKGRLVSNIEACERCSARHQPCHKQKDPWKIVCYECAEEKSRCSWNSALPRKLPRRHNKRYARDLEVNNEKRPRELRHGGSRADHSPRPQTLVDEIRLLNKRVARLETSLKKCQGGEADERIRQSRLPVVFPNSKAQRSRLSVTGREEVAMRKRQHPEVWVELRQLKRSRLEQAEAEEVRRAVLDNVLPQSPQSLDMDVKDGHSLESKFNGRQ